MANLLKTVLLACNRPVPRYTSYPPATCFTPQESDAEHAQRLCFAPENLALYIHIPFCSSLCHYCGCHMKVTHDYAHVSNYLNNLVAESMLVADMLPRRSVIHDVHFGGGSPSMLLPQDFSTLMHELRHALPIARNADIAIEADPRMMTPEHVAAYAREKVTRISLGVQDLNPRILELVNRPQSPQQTRDALALCRKNGMNVNFDLMYGLPGQTPATMALTLQYAAALRPDRISFFGYAHVPWVKKHMNLLPQERLPSPAMRLDMATMGAQILTDAGYTPIGIDHFALPGDSLAFAARHKTLRRNFQGYTATAADGLIGLGVSAISDLPEGYAQNTTDILRYGRDIAQGRLPVARGYQRSAEDAPCAHVIEKLMCDMSVDLQETAKRFGFCEDVFIPQLRDLQPYFQQGLIHMENGSQLVIKPEARLLTRIICTAFDRHALPAGQARHAQAI